MRLGARKKFTPCAAAAAGMAFALPALSLCIGLPPLDHEGLSLVPRFFQRSNEVLGCLARLSPFEVYQLDIHRVMPSCISCVNDIKVFG